METEEDEGNQQKNMGTVVEVMVKEEEKEETD